MRLRDLSELIALLILMTFAVIAMAKYASAAETCFPSLESARSGYSGHIAWNIVDGQRLYYRGDKHERKCAGHRPAHEARARSERKTHIPAASEPRAEASAFPSAHSFLSAANGGETLWHVSGTPSQIVMSMEIWDQGMQPAAREWQRRAEGEMVRRTLVVAFGGM